MKRFDAAPRRGMLLLLVLSILALFLVVGAVGVLLALRAREAARAFAAASAGAAGSAQMARTQLDEALLRLVRGGSPAGAVTESLLADKYGSNTTTGNLTALSGTAGAVMTATVTGITTTDPASLAGRVITFVPAAADSTLPSSYRILRTGSAANTLLIANVKPVNPVPLPSRFPCEVVINGREFTGQSGNEPYDAFDDQNPFLTQPVLQSSTVAMVARPAFGGPGTPCTVDNDGDGVADGIWLGDVLPKQRTSEGGELSFDVSYLVLDLDGRFNLNAHGSYVRAQLPQNTSQYPNDPNTVPLGMGYGPADVDASANVSTAAERQSGDVPVGWARLLQGGTVTRNAAVSSPTQWRPAPPAETVQAGRYGLGAAAQPGGSIITGTSPLNADFWMLNPAGNSPSDLKARLQVFTSGSPPTLRFARPSIGPVWVTSGTDTDDVLGAGAAAHPYRMRLDADAPRAAGTVAYDAVFTLGELERILRQFDADASQLPPRLAALLDELAERSRMTVTTDSWDTVAITGTAQFPRVSGAGVFAVYSPETVAGQRFNVNRPLVSAAVRQDFFRQLYTLVVTAGAAPAAAAQWAANVVEFRDPDSIMTWFPYDTNPLDGSWTTGTGVWGRERPELVITEATANGNQASVRLFRPWAAECTGGNTVPAERIDPVLGDVAGNTLNATATSGSDAVWRLSVGGSASGLNTVLTSATAVAVNTSAGQAMVNGSTPPQSVVLQRLADPSRPRDTNVASAAYNDYVEIHRVTIPTVARSVSRWLHWPNRDFVSHGELLAVPAGDPAEIAEACFDESKESSLARTTPAILDATIVPSRFAGAHVSVATGLTNLANTGLENFQFGQLSRWREAGRVNVNTILPDQGAPGSTPTNDVWTAIVGRPGLTNPATTQPIRNDRDLLVAGGDAVFGRSGADAASGFLKRSTAIRLANVATIRSHVFAVWVTLKITDSSANGGPPRYHRMFAIVDRSIPAGFQPGRTLNVRDTIRLQRYLE